MHYKYTDADLKIMQGWPLWRKIQVTQTRALEWIMRNDGKVHVSYSGGKDSRVLLDLVRRIDSNIPALFCDTGLEYPEVRRNALSTENITTVKPLKFDHEKREFVPTNFRETINICGYPAISKEVSKVVYYARAGKPWALKAIQGKNKDGSDSKFKQRFIKYRFLVDAPFTISNRCCDFMKKFPLEQYEKQTGSRPLIATMASESQQRKSGWLKTGCNAFDTDRPMSKPMSFWTEQDVLQYIKQFDIPIASVYGEIVKDGRQLKTTGESRTGCMFCMYGVHLDKDENKFQRMKKTHPAQYEYCINSLGCGQVLDYIGVPYQ